MTDAEISQMDIVWKFAIKDEDSKVIAGLDQFNNLHTYIPIEDVVRYLNDASNDYSSGFFLAVLLGMKIGEKKAAKEILTDWTDAEGFGQVISWAQEYGLTKEDIDQS